MYLDHNATTPMPAAVREAVLRAMDEVWGNPSSQHRQGQSAAMAVDTARRQVAEMVGRPAKDVSFTGGATEANAWALGGATTEERPHVVVSAVEHPSVLSWGTRIIGVDAEGQINLDELESALDPSVAVVSVMAANNETGVLQPVEQIADMARAHGITSHCDASQLPGRLPVRLSADWITLAGHKFGAPPGVGALVAAAPPPSWMRGGGQERGRRAGTHNVPGIVGMGAAAALVVERGVMSPRERDELEAACVAAGARVLGAGAPRLPNTTCVVFGVAGDMVVAALDLQGVAASTGSACGSGAARASHVVAAMGCQDVPVRFSLSADSTAASAIEVLLRVLDQMERACG